MRNLKGSIVNHYMILSNPHYILPLNTLWNNGAISCCIISSVSFILLVQSSKDKKIKKNQVADIKLILK